MGVGRRTPILRPSLDGWKDVYKYIYFFLYRPVTFFFSFFPLKKQNTIQLYR